VRGTIYEDVLGDGSLAGDIKASGVRVRLYRDVNDNGVVDGNDVFLEQITTNPSGTFNFKVQTNATGDHYLVAVDSRSVRPAAGFNAGFGADDVWAQQTVGDDPATRALDVGPFFGGVAPGVADAFNTAGTSPAVNAYQHVGRADVSAAHADNVDFGFSFNVVTNTLGGDNTVVQGSLRQFLVNANAVAGDNAMRFVPAVAANASGGAGRWWRVALIRVLPSLTDPGTVVDGTAYDPADGVTILDANPGFLGAAGTVGTGALALPPVARPELEITGSTGTPYGLRIQADLTTVRRLALHGFSSFGWNATMGAVLLETGTGAIIAENVLGSGPDAFVDPGTWRSVPNVTLAGATGGTLQGNLIGFSDRHGIEARPGTAGWLVAGNEILGNAATDGQQNGISLDGCDGLSVTGNLIHGNGGAGIDVFGAAGFVNLLDNTIRGNGVVATGGAETCGVRLDGGASLIRGNLIEANTGSGVIVTAGAAGHVLSMNSMADNGGLGIDLLVAGDDQRAGSPPYVTLNDTGDVDTGGNGATNFPVLETALNVSGTLTLSGWARPGADIEFFVAAPDPRGFGEGRTFVVSLIEGSAADLDGSASAYGPAAVAGTIVGQDDTNRFRFAIPLPADVTNGTVLTATATTGGMTSEFGAMTTVTGLVPNILVSKTTVTESDPVNLAANPKAIPGAAILNVIVATNTGPGTPDADAVQLVDPIPADTAIFVGDLGGGSGPVLFDDGAVPGGLTIGFGGLGDPSDDVAFSADGGVTWDYVPAPDAQGFDAAVTHLRLTPRGVFAASDGVNHPSFSVSFRTRVR
jgi:parallel beta-helix repeat protein